MPKSIRVPWFQWKRFRVRGVVTEHATGRPLAGMRVCAFDQDLVRDDFLGDTATDDRGRFEIQFLDDRFKDFAESRPDLYLQVFAPGSSQPVADTSYEVRHDASEDEFFEIRVPGRGVPAD